MRRVPLFCHCLSHIIESIHHADIALNLQCAGGSDRCCVASSDGRTFRPLLAFRKETVRAIHKCTLTIVAISKSDIYTFIAMGWTDYSLS